MNAWFIIIRGVYSDMAKVAYGWMAITLSYLRVDAWPKSPTSVQSLHSKLTTSRRMAKVTYG